ncbi:MAG: dephospho-CoA kinase [Verrucomicrobia bacterium]|nr:dephospho-CoA kinase [Kiritimatiellia bacterium]MCP5487476.1 dephospho-CoA kinase [Verrucomicrobiota bacterium]
MNPNGRARPSRFPRIGVTGGIGCGKSTAGSALIECGVAVLDTDGVARQLLAPGTEVYDALVMMFGSSVLLPDTEIHRAWLAEQMFGDPVVKSRVEALMHPVIRSRVAAWLEQQTGPAAVIVPLLFEAGYEDLFTVTVCIAVSDDEALNRCVARGMDRMDAARRQASQWRLAQKMEKADIVLWNDGSPEVFRETVRQWYEAWLKKETDNE